MTAARLLRAHALWLVVGALLTLLVGHDLVADPDPLGLAIGVAAVAAIVLVATRAGQAREQGRERDELYRAIVETCHDGIWTVDAEGRTTFVNPRLAELLGYAPEEMLGRPQLDFMPETEHADAAANVGRRRAGISDQHERRLRRRDGSILHTLLAASPLRTRDGRHRGAVATVTDVTDRKRREEDLAERAALVTATHDAVIGVDLLGRISRWNPGAERLYGYSAAEAIGLPVTALCPSDRGEEAIEILRRTQRGETIVDLATTRLTKEGRALDVMMTISPLRDGQGRVTGYCGIVRDLTQRKRLEEQLRHASKMEAIGVLAGGVAHDFNNSLMAIRGYSELLLAQLAADDPVRSDAEAIHKAAEGAASVTRQLLAFSRRQVLEPQLVDVEEVVSGIEPMLQRLVGEAIELRWLPHGGLGRVRADRSQLEQVLVNLAANARDAMPDGGTLTVRTGEADLPTADALGQARRCVLLSVGDTGHGMTPEVRERAFEPFFTTKDSVLAAGLGLATVYGIVQQSGGRVWASSELGRGATFEIFLPLAEEPVAAVTAAAGAAGALEGSETVLLVEDEETVRNVVRQMLAARGYTVLEARDGEDALGVAAAHDGPIDLVVSDVVMPRLGGPDLVERLRVSRPSVRVLFVSGYSDDRVHDRLLEDGVVFLQKPFAGAALARKAREALELPVAAVAGGGR